MFTGIVEELGEVVGVEHLAEAARLTVRGPRVTADATQGGSIAVNGVCLTVSAVAGDAFTADVMAETLHRSALGALEPGSLVNLERSLRVGDRLGGHLVQGHVDGVATVMSRVTGEHWEVVRITIPPGLGRYLVQKGSVAVDGVSLTISALGPGGVGPGEHSAAPGESPRAPRPGAPRRSGADPWFEVSLIPATLAVTTLGRVQPGSTVNLEVDMIGKYVERMLRTEPEMARP